MPEASLARPPTSPRDPLLDLLRSVALARVVLWHTFAAPWLTLVAAMPVLFFVAGALLSTSLTARSSFGVLVRRARRLLVPLWCYGLAVGAAGVFRGALSGDPGDHSWRALARAAAWILPVVDPGSSDWHGGWLSTHLWYLRAYLWVLLLAPLFVLLARRLRFAVPAFALAILALEMAGAGAVPGIGGGELRVVAGDLVVYGLFVTLGIAYQQRRRAPAPRPLAAGSVVAAAAAGIWFWFAGLPAGGVNESYPGVLLTGLAWLLALGAGEAHLRRVASRPRVEAATRLITRRAVTLYLWHPVAIVTAYAVVDRFEPPNPLAGGLAVVALVVVLVVVVSLVMGRVEDLAAGRARPLSRPAVWGRAFVPALCLAAVLPLVMLPVLPEVAQASGRSWSARRPPPPSYRPALADSAFARRAAGPSDGIPLAAGRLPTDALQAGLDRWMARQEGLDSIAVGLTVGSRTWTADAARPASPSRVSAADPYNVASVTKTFTVALVLQQVAAGKLTLDGPVPPLGGLGVSNPPVTVRQLLQHTSGLVDYRDAPGYDPQRQLGPVRALRLALAAPRLAPPGEQNFYANVNYHYLGLLLEQGTGRSYGDLVGRLVRRERLSQTMVDPSGGPGWVGFASGGVSSTVGELSRWGSALFTPGRVIRGPLASRFTTLGRHNLGLGVWPLCPCSTDETGQKRYTAIGQYSGHGGLYHFPGSGVTLAVRMDPGQEGADSKVASLSEELHRVLRTSRSGSR